MLNYVTVEISKNCKKAKEKEIIKHYIPVDKFFPPTGIQTNNSETTIQCTYTRIK